jgi:hypothetical protein
VDQHVISEWLLKAFARKAPGGLLLEVYDKATGLYDDAAPANFMIELDAHSTQVERGLERIETPAAQAALRLAKRIKILPPGLYAVVEPGAETRAVGPELSDKGVFEGMRLLVGERQVPSPSPADRLALGRYAALMYQRAPKIEAAARQLEVDYEVGAQLALDRLMPGMRSKLAWVVEERRSRILGSAEDIGMKLANATWWVLRAGDGEAFVLGDSPVAATVSLGHDDTWRAILSPQSFVVAMPLGPNLALLIAPKLLMPMSNVDALGMTRAINRLLWRWADRFVLAHDRGQLEAAMPGADDAMRRESVRAEVDAGQVRMRARGDVALIVAAMAWRHWTSCRLEFGLQPRPAEERYPFASPLERGAGSRPPVRTIGPIRRR